MNGTLAKTLKNCMLSIRLDNMTTYDKLVRDNIPALIEESGDTAATHRASEEEYRERLRAKLLEEAEEFHESGAVEELGDVLEVVHAICEQYAISWEELERIRHAKREERGGFAERIVLERVD